MTWQPEIDEIARRAAMTRQMGGAEKVERQHAQGKLTVRERVERLVDPASFREIGAISGKAVYDETGKLVSMSPANTIFGRALVGGKPVVVQGDDFTVRGGAADAAIWQKQVMAEHMARELRLPIIRLIDGTGGGGSVKSLDTDARTYVPANPGWDHVVANLATVPVVALALAFGALGWAIPVKAVLIAYLVFLPALAVQWRLNRDSCLLDNLESWLKHGRFRAGAANPNEGAFLANLVHRVFRIRVLEPLASRLIYIAMAILFAFGAFHLAWRW